MRSLSHDEYLALRRFPAFDGVRAIAAIIVFAFHFGGPNWGFISGWVGVHLFFVLSGFLITTLLLREEAQHGRISLRAFYIRRLFRIMPAYLAVLAVTYALVHVNGTGAAFRSAVPHYLLLVNEFAPSTHMFLHSWTIAIEQKFYLFWPVIAFVAVAGAFAKRIAVTLIAIGVLVAFIPTATAFPFWPIHYVAILIGCLMAIVMHHPRGYALMRPLTHPVTATMVIIGFGLFHLALPYWPAAADGHAESAIAAYAVGTALLLPALLARTLPARLLSTRPMAWIGERSYSLYLVQMLAAAAVTGLVPAYTRPDTKYLIGTIIIGLLAADLLYRWVETPMIKVGRRLSARPATPEPAQGSQHAYIPSPRTSDVGQPGQDAGIVGQGLVRAP